MSKSNVTNIHDELSPRPELEVDDAALAAGDELPALEVDPISDEEADPKETADTAPPVEPEPEKAKTSGKTRLVAIVLALLLLLSVGVNFMQARTTARLDAQNKEFEAALNEAVGVIDQETVRANTAESTIAEIDGAVETVNDRIDSLQQALSDLRRMTER